MVGRASLSSFSLSLSSAAQRQPSHPGQHPSSSQSSQAQIQAQQRTSSGRTETGAWPCTLDGCNKVFAREADLKRHQRTTKSHSIPGSNVANACPLCEATFTRSDAMRRHLKSRHQGRTPETLNLPDTPSGPSSSHISSGASSSRGILRRAYSPSEETSELSASDNEQQQSYHHYHQQQQHQQTTTSSQQPYASSSRNPSTNVSSGSASYYSSPPMSPVQTAPSPTSPHHGMHHQNASNLSSQVLYQAAMSSEIQHALSSPRHPSATVSPPSSSSSSSRRDTTTTSAAYPMHPQQAVSMPMSSQQPQSSYSPYTSPVSEQYPEYQQYPAYTSSSGYHVTGGGGSGGGGGNGSNVYANPYMGTANRAGGGYMMNNGTVPWGGKVEEGMMDDGRGGIPPSRQPGGLATLAMHASRIRPMSPLSPAKARSSKSELENALGPAGVHRR